MSVAALMREALTCETRKAGWLKTFGESVVTMPLCRLALAAGLERLVLRAAGDPCDTMASNRVAATRLSTDHGSRKPPPLSRQHRRGAEFS